MACEAFKNHQLHAQSFSGSEMAALKELLAGHPNPLKGRDLELFEEKLGSC